MLARADLRYYAVSPLHQVTGPQLHRTPHTEGWDAAPHPKAQADPPRSRRRAAWAARRLRERAALHGLAQDRRGAQDPGPVRLRLLAVRRRLHRRPGWSALRDVAVPGPAGPRAAGADPRQHDPR